MLYTVTVTQEDIDHGRQGDCEMCPVARALTREIPCPDGQRWSVTTPIAFIVTDDEESAIVRRIRLSDECFEFISEFDYSGNVKPFTFTLEV